ncbi:hypothetical protein CABS01_16114 [Colletotrichum abscissum]|uniref:uncharacterized protein n=1 Tax=Colletotrichum abscissum TaxID=1671311 RepID=UPI0027D54A7D|nr:uncharacterized protein CABS01_16114 [Colletotrichum abscissum]KAK1472896.1 hypothetical protein CABS01_16114 [Colletotrichum abscissum]
MADRLTVIKIEPRKDHTDASVELWARRDCARLRDVPKKKKKKHTTIAGPHEAHQPIGKDLDGPQQTNLR